MKASNIRAGVSAPIRQTSAEAPSAEFIEDADGRRLQLRELTILEENDVIIAAGLHGENARTLVRVLLAARVAAITRKGDDDPEGMPVPTKPEQYRRMMMLVGHAGVDAVYRHITPDEEDETAPTEIEHAKN